MQFSTVDCSVIFIVWKIHMNKSDEENIWKICLEYIPLIFINLVLMCIHTFSSVAQSLRLFVVPRTTARQASLSITNSPSLLTLMSIESVMPSNHLLCHPLLPSLFPSITVFSNESVLCIRCPKYWSFSISSSNEYLRFISFMIDGLISLQSKGVSRSFSRGSSWPRDWTQVSCIAGRCFTLWATRES